MRAVAQVVAAAIMLVARTGNALDPTGADVIGLRLGMSVTEATVALRRQGFAPAHDHGTLTARTRDGRLTIDLTQDQAVWRIRYAFTANGAGEAAKILDSVVDRFGAPDQTRPMLWCRMTNPGGQCPADAPSMTFFSETNTLLLQAGTQAP